MKYDRIIITGFMGTGKSSVGKLLASKLKWLFFDTDALAESTEGMPIPEIFEKKGEPYFRKLERRCLEGLVSMREVVISTGGGTLLDQNNFNLAAENQSGLVCLTASFEEIKKRLSKVKSTRPLLKSGLDAAADLLKEREPLYKKMGVQIDNTKLTLQETCDRILSTLKIDVE